MALEQGAGEHTGGRDGTREASEEDGPAPLRLLVERYDPTVLDGSQEGRRVRLALSGEGAWDVVLTGGAARLEPVTAASPAATLTADRATWQHIAHDLRGGMDAFRAGRLLVRRNLHLGVGFLAATSGMRPPAGLAFRCIETESGTMSVVEAGEGPPVLLLHGLGATKLSFLPTTVALASAGFRTIAVDLPGFGDSVKPLLAPYHPPFFARAMIDLMDALSIDRAHVAGNSMGGRVALELGLRYPDRVRRLALIAPSLAWRRGRPWAPFVRLLRPELGFVQATPRWVIEGIVHRIIPAAAGGWVHAGVDEFLRAYLTPRGRVALYAAARNIYLEEPHGEKGFWTRLERMQAACLFIWGRLDRLVPIGFARHVAAVLPAADQLYLDCGHVPQLERPVETHTAIAAFLQRPEPHAEPASVAAET